MRTSFLTAFMLLACPIAMAQDSTPSAARDHGPPVAGLSDLPLIEVLAKRGAGNFLAVHITGDGGYGTTDQGLSESLAAHGIPVVVLNSLRYFWKKRTPAEAAGDLERILEHYRSAWHREKYVMIGYSMGADVMPFMLTRLPKSSLERVALVAFLGPGKEASFQFRFIQWFGHPPSDSSLQVEPEIGKLRGIPILCFAGDEDKEAICDHLEPTLAKSIELKGGHRVGSHYGPVADAILLELGLKK